MSNNPDCCGKEMEELVGTVSDDENDEIYDVVMGYKCKVCGLKLGMDGEDIV